MLREMIGIYCDNGTEHTRVFCNNWQGLLLLRQVENRDTTALSNLKLKHVIILERIFRSIVSRIWDFKLFISLL